MAPLTRADAEELVQHLLAMVPSNTELVVNRRHTRAEPWGWVIFYNSREFVETGREDRMLFGNGPFFVSKRAEVLTGGTGVPVDHYVAALETELDPSASGFAIQMRRLVTIFRGAIPDRIGDADVAAALPDGPLRDKVVGWFPSRED